jgi:hypothetical protein
MAGPNTIYLELQTDKIPGFNEAILKFIELTGEEAKRVCEEKDCPCSSCLRFISHSSLKASRISMAP